MVCQLIMLLLASPFLVASLCSVTLVLGFFASFNEAFEEFDLDCPLSVGVGFVLVLNVGQQVS